MKTLLLSCLTLLSFALAAQDSLRINFSHPAGYYKDSLFIKIFSNPPGASIYYTLDGSKPNSNATRYSKPIYLDTPRVVRAIAYFNGKSSTVITNTYLVKEPVSKHPIVSVSIPHAELFDPYRGLFLKGPRASNKFPFKGANYFSNREVPCYVEIFEENHEKVFEGKLGFKIFGGMSRIFPQKSFSLYGSRRRYNQKHIEHQIFPEKEQKKYKRIVMRNSGSDFGETHFRDALITSFGKEMGLETQAYRPAIVYINGHYWGIYNFREKLTRHYIKENFGYDKDSIDLIEHRKSIQAGSRKHYDKMRIFMMNNNLSSQENFDVVANMMDVENFMEYQILQIFIDNQDAGGNIKFWRPQTEDGKWRWILFDTDFGLGHYGRNGYKNNSLKFHTEPNGPIWPNPPWSTLNLRSLLQNEDFQVRFISRFLDRMNYTLDSTRIINRIDAFAARIRDELPRHWKRWKLSEKEWKKEINRMKEFVKERPKYMRGFIREMYPWVGEEVMLNVNIDSGGYVILNQAIPVHGSFKGVYFEKVPVSLKAKPYFGHQFSHWEMNGEVIKNDQIELRLEKGEQHIKAIYNKGEHPAVRQMIINEISFADTISGDWIEFYNDTELEFDITGWKLMDGNGKEFILPPAVIQPKNYLVICRDAARFSNSFPTCKNYISGLSFGLSKKETIMLYDDQEQPVDSISYDLKESDIKDIKTLVLRNYNESNELSNNWAPQTKSGSPASVNPEYLEIEEQENWESFLEMIKVGGITTAIFMAIMLAYISVRKHLQKID